MGKKLEIVYFQETVEKCNFRNIYMPIIAPWESIKENLDYIYDANFYAKRLNISNEQLDLLKTGKLRIRKKLATRIAEVTATNPEFWIKLDKNFCREKTVEK